MKGAPLRIDLHPNQKSLSDNETPAQPTGLAKWTEAVTKLVPGEVVAAYLAGRSVLASEPPMGLAAWILWTVFCLLIVIGLRLWMTSDSKAAVPPEKTSVTISALSFLVWIYSFGDVFRLLGVWSPRGSTLVLIGWTLAAPLLYFLIKRFARE